MTFLPNPIARFSEIQDVKKWVLENDAKVYIDLNNENVLIPVEIPRFFEIIKKHGGSFVDYNGNFKLVKAYCVKNKYFIVVNSDTSVF